MFSSKPILMVLAVSGLLITTTYAQTAGSNTSVSIYFQQAKIEILKKAQFTDCQGSIQPYGEDRLSIPLCKNEKNILTYDKNKLTLTKDSTLTACGDDDECAHPYNLRPKIYYTSQYCASSKMHDILTNPKNYNSVTISAGVGHNEYLYMLVECNTQSNNSD